MASASAASAVRWNTAATTGGTFVVVAAVGEAAGAEVEVETDGKARAFNESTSQQSLPDSVRRSNGRAARICFSPHPLQAIVPTPPRQQNLRVASMSVG